MIDAPPPLRSDVADQVWRWLPGVYRTRDTDGQLRGFLSLFSDELWRLRMLLEQSYADRFIDSAQDWAIAYLADLVGTDVLFTGEAASLRETAARNREDVKNTMRWRRQKGTLAGLEGVAADVGGFGVHAVEMFERLAWLQHLEHIRPAATFAIDLRDGEAVAALATPFSQGHALVDLRPADWRVGRHRTSNVAVFEWPLESFPLAHVAPLALGHGCFAFHPLGLATALHAGGATDALRAQVAALPGAAGADICAPNADDTPIRTRDLRAHPAAYVDSPLGFAIREDGIALVGGPPAGLPSVAPAQDFGDLADRRGMVAPDTGVYAAGTQFELDAVRLGAVFELVEGVQTPVPYSPGQAFVSQLQLREPAGRLALDTVTPDFGYTTAVAPYEPDSGEFHYPALLLRITNTGAAAAVFPESEAILRSARGQALQVALPALPALAPAASLHLYAADDGSTYFARGDHGAGVPDRNPDDSMFGAFSAQHLARASEGQRRLRPGRPAGAARWRRVAARPLCCIDQPLKPPLAPGDVGVDAERGRFMFPPGEAPAGELDVDFRFALGTTLGAGPFARPGLPGARITVARRRDADHATIQAAIDAAPDGAAIPIVIEILDSATYAEALMVANRSFPGGLVLQAAALQTPTIVKPAASPKALQVTHSGIGGLTLDGLVFAGGELAIGGTVSSVSLRQCSLQPASASLTVTQAGRCDLQLAACLSGPVTLAATAGDVTATDSAFQHPAATVEHPAGAAAIACPAGAVALTRCTVFGDLSAAGASLSNTLLYGALALSPNAPTCLRFSRLPADALAGAFRCTHATPIFVSCTWGDAGWLFLHPNTSAALRGGGEEGGEIGVYHGAGLPWRVQNAGIRLLENIPAGLTPLQVGVLPGLRFRGRTRS